MTTSLLEQMEMFSVARVNFNVNPIVLGKKIEQPSNLDIKSTFGLWNASLDDALKYGGDITKTAIGVMNLRYDRRYIVVDTKIHMLMPGFSPAIPGFHTDGVPRGLELHPGGKGHPDILSQLRPDFRSPRYHLLVTGTGCLTKFIKDPLELSVPVKPNPDLYKFVTQQINFIKPELIESPSCQVVEWDWWNLHTAVVATKHEWRYLIRVTETDFIEPQKDLREVIRTQSQVYIPQEFGW